MQEQKLVYLIMGPQGCGKGTQAKIISEKLKVPHISTGDLLRATTGKLKEEVDAYTKMGKFAPDDLILEILEKRMQEPDCRYGVMLDGFPRNMAQAHTLDSKLKVEKVISIEISDEEAVKRLSGRYNCEKCKAGYNIYTAPKPKVNGICDKCGGNLTQRDDDTSEQAIRERLSIYHSTTKPILQHYKDRLITIDGEQSIEKVTKDISQKLRLE